MIDDEAELRMLLRDDLEADGFQIATASNGPEALDLLGRLTPALIVLDLNLGPYSGESVAAVLKGRNTTPVPIVVVSLDPRMRERIRDLPGVVACLKKPFDLADLRAIVHALVRHRQTSPRASSPPASEP